MTATKITATELARNLSDILSRVRYKGERFAVERSGETIAELRPTDAPRTTTWNELLALLTSLPMPDDRFEADLKAIRADQPLLPPTPWDD